MSLWVRFALLAFLILPFSLAISEEEYWAWSSEEEGECDENNFWHIRGRHCVPYICPRGNSQRNFETGECLYSGDIDMAEAAEGEVEGRHLAAVDTATTLLQSRTPSDLPQRWWSDQPKGFAKMSDGHSKADKGLGLGRRKMMITRKTMMKHQQQMSPSPRTYSL